MNNETIGISAEIAIADYFDVEIDRDYRERGDNAVIDMIYPEVEDNIIYRVNPKFCVKSLRDLQNGI